MFTTDHRTKNPTTDNALLATDRTHNTTPKNAPSATLPNRHNKRTSPHLRKNPHLTTRLRCAPTAKTPHARALPTTPSRISRNLFSHLHLPTIPNHFIHFHPHARRIHYAVTSLPPGMRSRLKVGDFAGGGEEMVVRGEFEELGDTLAGGGGDGVMEILGEVLAGQVTRPKFLGGVTVEEGVGHGGALALCLGEELGEVGGAGGGVVAADHPHGEDERERGEDFPLLAKVELEEVFVLGRGGVDDFVADEEHGFMGFGFGGRRGGWFDGACLVATARRASRLKGGGEGAGLAFVGFEGDDFGGSREAFAEDELGEDDGGVGVGVGVEAGDAVGRDLGEDADGEGGAVAADAAGGDEEERDGGGLVVDDGEEGSGGAVGGDEGEQVGGDGEFDGDTGVGEKRLDEGLGVGEGDAGDGVGGVHGGDGNW